MKFLQIYLGYALAQNDTDIVMLEDLQRYRDEVRTRIIPFGKKET